MLQSAKSARPSDAPRASVAPLCDPVTLEIIRGAIAAAQAEMEALLERTAISAFIREKKDFYTALFDENGVMAVGSMVPIFGDMTSPVFESFPPETMKPGDLFWYNDCYGSRGAVSHSNDQVLLAPVFKDGRRCAFVMSWAHFADIGGIRPGSISPDATEVFQEGIIIPVTKVVDEGKVNEAALAIFHRNSRFPDQSNGDMRALMASVELGVKRVGEILDRFGPDVVADAFAQLLARTRRLVRTRLAETFDYGTHRFTDAIDADGHGNGPFKIRFALTREKGRDGEDRFIFDATETDDQAPGPVNYLMNPGVPGMALGLYLSGRRSGPGLQCRGTERHRRGEAARRLAAGAAVSCPARHARPHDHARHLRHRRPGQCCQERCSCGQLGVCHRHHARPFPQRGRRVGTLPARGRHRCRLWCAAERGRHRCGLFRGTGELPVEFLEVGYPVRLRTYGIVRDSGGAGRFRGGCGIVREYEILAEDAMLAIRIDSIKNPPWGIDGGMSGGTGRAVINPGTSRERVLAPLSDGNRLVRGDILRIETGGGGGYGHPFDRPAETVLEDVLGGYVSREAAERLYGVVLDGDRVDEDATARARASRPSVRRFHRQEYVDVLA